MAGRPVRNQLAVCLMHTALFSCETSPHEGEPGDPSGSDILAPFSDLEFLEAQDDPFAAHRPAEIICNNLTGYYREESSLEVSTAHCNYLSLVEPAHVSARAGDVVTTEISHFDLTAPEPATAHVALFAGPHVLFEQDVEIPGPAQVISVSVALPADIEPGELVGIHLHNHGQNTWNFGPLVLER